MSGCGCGLSCCSISSFVVERRSRFDSRTSPLVPFVVPGEGGSQARSKNSSKMAAQHVPAERGRAEIPPPNNA